MTAAAFPRSAWQGVAPTQGPRGTAPAQCPPDLERQIHARVSAGRREGSGKTASTPASGLKGWAAGHVGRTDQYGALWRPARSCRRRCGSPARPGMALTLCLPSDLKWKEVSPSSQGHDPSHGGPGIQASHHFPVDLGLLGLRAGLCLPIRQGL